MDAVVPAARRRASSSEQEIRDALVDFLHRELPKARVIHELATGGCRADVAAVEPERLMLFEIKSAKDTLDRLSAQMKEFQAVGHHAFVVPHEKWFDRTPYDNGAARFVWPRDEYRYDVWAYPEDAGSSSVTPYMYRWRLPKPTLSQPHSRNLLFLLWKDELLAECAEHQIKVNSRTRNPDLVDLLAYRLTGQQIARAVCRQLRGRPILEADPPILTPEPNHDDRN
ncbi:MAG: hypothetical protein P0Y66_22430 [Candidatus Kaistia colombiensis]|nr:MAG: hypothetical protein P0Y66_22430 [Kaistia sp.]